MSYFHDLSIHRPSKFPDVELSLRGWLSDCKKQNVPITDNMIRQKAKDTARELGIGDDKFKASSGWIENFKHRHGIRKGVWIGDGKLRRTSMALRSSMRPPSVQPEDGGVPVPAPSQMTSGAVSSQQPQPEAVSPDFDGSMTMRTTPVGYDLPQGTALEPSTVGNLQWQDQHDMMMTASYDETTPVATESQTGMYEALNRSHEDFMDANQNVLEQTDRVSQQEFSQHQEISSNFSQYPEEFVRDHANDHQLQSMPAPAPPAADSNVVSVAEANDAVDKILTFVRTQRDGFLTDNQADVLYGLRRALWLSEHHQGAALSPSDMNSMTVRGQDGQNSGGSWAT